MATQVFELANRAMGGRLPDLLTRWRSERLNRDEIADKLRTEHGIDVSGRTVDRWARDLGEDTSRRRVSA
jgi:hypothetical protein